MKCAKKEGQEFHHPDLDLFHPSSTNVCNTITPIKSTVR
jgi:hypothetical protein